MHRHGYKGRKFNRERDQRAALIKSLAESLIKHESIETTLPKAKEVVPYVERLVTKAKKGDLYNRRQIISSLQTIASAHKLVDDIAPRFKERNGGYLRIERTVNRRGDNALLARVSFVAGDDKSTPKNKDMPDTKAAVPKMVRKPAAKQPAAKKETSQETKK